MKNKEKYREYCVSERNIPVFSKDWWLDTVCGEDNWDVVLSEINGDIVASMPYYLTKRFKLNNILMPRLTQNMGPWICYPSGQKYSSKLSYEKQVLTELIEQLPPFGSFGQNFHYSIANWLPFYWKGFQQTTRYTYVIEDLSDLDTVYKNFKKQLRKEIKKIENEIEICLEDDIEKFYYINSLTYKRQNKETPFSLEYLKKIDQACLQKNCRSIIFAKDEKSRVHTVLYLIWDDNSAYDLLGGTDPAYKTSNAKSLITWEAIKFASKVTKKFDFEGSMMQNVEQFIRGFGAVQKPYFYVYKVNSKTIRIINAMKQVMK